MAKVTARTDGSMPGAIDRCKFFPTTISSDPTYPEKLGFDSSLERKLFVD